MPKDKITSQEVNQFFKHIDNKMSEAGVETVTDLVFGRGTTEKLMSLENDFDEEGVVGYGLNGKRKHND